MLYRSLRRKSRSR